MRGCERVLSSPSGNCAGSSSEAEASPANPMSQSPCSLARPSMESPRFTGLSSILFSAGAESSPRVRISRM